MRRLCVLIFGLAIASNPVNAASLEQVVAMQQAQIEQLKPKVKTLNPVSMLALDPVTSKITAASSSVVIQKVGIMCTAVVKLAGLKKEGPVYALGIDLPSGFQPIDDGMWSAAVNANWSGTQFFEIFSSNGRIAVYHNNKDVPVQFGDGTALYFTYTYQCSKV